MFRLIFGKVKGDSWLIKERKGGGAVAYYDCPIVLRLSGGVLKDGGEVFSTRLNQIADELADVAGMAKLAVVVGGGNITRGKDLVDRLGLDPILADNVGIMATILNAYLLSALLTSRKIPNVVVSAQNVGGFISQCRQPSVGYISQCFRREEMVIVGGGTGKGGVTTDTAAVRLARDLRAGIIFKGTGVRGIFSGNPDLVSQVDFLPKLTCSEFNRRGLNTIFDPTAVEETRISKIPVRIFGILTRGLLRKAFAGQPVGSLLTPDAVVAA